MTRKEMYVFIAKHNLQDFIKSSTGKHFTNCSNDVLDGIIKSFVPTATDCAENNYDLGTEKCVCSEYKSKYEKLLTALAACLVSLDTDIDKDLADNYARLKEIVRNC